MMRRKAIHRPGAAALRTNPHSAALRAAGLKVTSARLATLRLAPQVLAAEGQLTPRNLRAAMQAAGFVVSASALQDVLTRLRSAGLLPAAAPGSRTSVPRASRIAGAAAADRGVPDDDHASRHTR